MEKPHPLHTHVLLLGSKGLGEGKFTALFSLSALLHSFIFFPFVLGTFLSPSCLPLPWGEHAGMDSGLSSGSQDSGPAGAGTLLGAHCVREGQKSVPGSAHAWGSLSSCPGREGAQSQGWGEWEVLHCGSSGCFAYPCLCLTSLFPHLFP